MERAFDPVIDHVKRVQEFEVVRLVAPFESTGAFKRLLIGVWAFFNQGDVNHVTGDIHFACVFLNRSKTVLTVHDCEPLGRLRGLRKRMFELLWLQLPMAAAARVTAVSQFTADQLAPYRSREKVVDVIPNACRIASRSDTKTMPDHPLVLQVGARKNKNLYNLARALAGVSCTVRIIGRASEQDAAEFRKCGVPYEVVNDLSDREIEEEYLASDVVTFLSTFEGFGLPILEAQASARPLVTSDREPMSSVAGGGALLVNPERPDEIRQAIQKIISDTQLREALVTRGRRNVRKYSPARVADCYIGVYRQILDGALSD
jgi:glycosyltransferase involved in cell wall biosynthesis